MKRAAVLSKTRAHTLWDAWRQRLLLSRLRRIPPEWRPTPNRGIQHGDHVLGPVLPGGNNIPLESVGGPSAATIKENQTAERGQPLERLGTSWVLPEHVDMTSEAVAVQQVNRAVTNDLIGDISIAHGDVAGLGTLHVGGQSVSISKKCHWMQNAIG